MWARACGGRYNPKPGARAAHVVSGLAKLGITVRETVYPGRHQAAILARMRLNFLSVPLFQLLSGEIVLAAGDGREVGIGAGQSGLPLLDRDPSLSNRVFNFNICRP